MPANTAATVGWLLILAAAAGFYALVLSKMRARYEPDWTWVTVVIGNGLIGLALWGMELSGVRITFLLVLLANIAAGAPIIIWQVGQYIARQARNGHAKP